MKGTGSTAACAFSGPAGTIGIAALMLMASGLAMPALAQSPEPAAPAARAATQTASRPTAGKPTSDYYVEFRAARIGLYGHSYVAYGRLDRRGEPDSKVGYADLHPMGGYGVMALGHLLPVPANTEWNPEVQALPIAHKYRVNLNETQYKSLMAAVERGRTNNRYWNAATNNCNHFIGELAKAVGLRVPMQFHLSYGFVPDLQELNASGQAAGAR